MSEFSEYILCERLTFWIWKIYGFWATEDESQYYRAYRWLYHFFFTVIYIFAMFVSFFVAENAEELWSEVMFMLLTDTAMFVKYIFIVSNFETLIKLHEQTISEDFRPQTDRQAETYRRQFTLFSNTMVAYYICSLVSVWTHLELLFDGRFKLPFSNWFYWVPMGEDTLTYYHLVFAYEMFGMTGHCVLNVAADSQIAYLIFTAGFQLDNLCDKLVNLSVPDSATYVEKAKYQRAFIDAIENFAHKVEEIFSLAVFLQICASGITICAVMFRLSEINLVKDLGSAIPMMFYLMAMLGQILLPCLVGNEVTYKSNQLTNALFKSDWLKLPVAYRKDMQRFMLRTNKPITLKAGNFFNYNLETFTSTLNTAYTIYAVLKHREKGT
ncbi:odorant receptor 94a-like [Sabethes cyaneus]|uniref:odorant receptor 94a-like n=1 Tax=Sabethes cyaneus TaxID=53552 RepID=UPI00237EE8DA|nr:odorant receptor 94a-like [Sabethes cyaneus]